MTWSYTDSDNARLAAIEAALQRTEQTLDAAEAGLTRVREAYDQAHDDWCAGTATGARFVRVRETVTPAWGQAVADALVGPAPLAEATTAAREATTAAAEPNVFTDAMQRMFEGDPATRRPLTGQDMLAIQGTLEGARAKRPASGSQAIAEGELVRDAFERGCAGLGPTAR